ncbi:hypothetical protein Nepgr_028230 [Nepenthes gracilis]|uniref:FHA domain-containing protein n=1 Tax=Nepenthes gracilis TaxID=150966 RepID=A0AAD3TDA1_NEPGR|nr:hypothetical protein Nepgr_028230 [Nepenthes gracilis]
MRSFDTSSSYAYQSRNINNKRSRGNNVLQKPSSSVKKSKRKAAVALVDVKQLDHDGNDNDNDQEGDGDVPLFTTSTGRRCSALCLNPDQPYTIGRSARHSHFMFCHPCVSKRHCQILFDASLRKLYILDGAFSVTHNVSVCCIVNQFRDRLIKMKEKDEEMERGIPISASMARFRASMNGVFLNGVRIGEGFATELSAGDEVMLVCGNETGACGSCSRIGFIISRIVFQEEAVEHRCDDNPSEKLMLFRSLSTGKLNKRIFALSKSDSELFRSGCDDIVAQAKALLTCCRQILCSDDPVSYIRRCVVPRYDFDGTNDCNSKKRELHNHLEFPLNGGLQVKSAMPGLRQQKRFFDSSDIMRSMQILGAPVVLSTSIAIPRQKVASMEAKGDHRECVTDAFNRDIDNDITNGLPLNSVDGRNAYSDVVGQNRCWDKFILSPGKNFYLNRLVDMQHSSIGQCNVTSLPELLHPIDRITKMFVATFTSDILWFLSYCKIPIHLPVTIACHNSERCWSTGLDQRSSVPYPEYPNLVVVYPPFPVVVAFGKESKKQGIACHHPKLLVLQREDSMRVIVTSANLVAKQWNNVTNTIWWQDFPRSVSPDFSCLFTQIQNADANENSKSDFAAQLAGFMATLLTDVPSQAHWIVELTKYDFSGATGYLIASVPGIHSFRARSSSELMQFLSAYQCKSSSSDMNFLGSVEASVVGLSHLFQTKADSNGARLRKLATFLGKSCKKEFGMADIVLKRSKNVPADANAVSVLVPYPNESSEGDCVQLGFLPRNTAKWVSPLWDIEFFRFSGYIFPKEALEAALGGNGMKVQLILHVSQGPNFQDMLKMMQFEHVIALCSLIASLQRSVGLWRLEEVLSRYKWPEALESDFIYGASSIGSSLNPQFLAAFSSAAGKKQLQPFDSEESDPEWGCWNASHELKCPSMRVIFPTIERVKNARSGILPSKYILCFSERTWQRLKMVDILHDAIPHPSERAGHPMHIKVARRRFQSKAGTSSFGWVYCGSHNLSPAAWGRPISGPSAGQVNGSVNSTSSASRLHICNYELGVVFVFPPPETYGHTEKSSMRLDDIILPFLMPAPKYGPQDRPATKQAMKEALAEMVAEAATVAVEEVTEEIPDEEEEVTEAAQYMAAAAEEEEERRPMQRYCGVRSTHWRVSLILTVFLMVKILSMQLGWLRLLV